MIGYIKYKLSKKFLGNKVINSEILNYLYNKYITYNYKLHIEQAFSENQFKNIFSIFYDSLCTCINDSEFVYITDRYIKILLSHQLDGIIIDNQFIIKNINCLVDAASNTIVDGNKYKELLEIIKNDIIQKYDIDNKIEVHNGNF